MPNSAASLRRPVDWTNATFLVLVHLLAVGAVVYMAAVPFSWATVGQGALWAFLTGLGVTAGYHRLIAHRAWRANPVVKALLLGFGAGAVQNSGLTWSADHRRHHAHTDKDEDPYNISRGFFWAHMGWIFFKDSNRSYDWVKDLQDDRLVQLQHRFYLPLALFFGGLLPALIALSWGDFLGGLLVVGFLRLALIWHATFFVNSLAHTLGSQPYSKKVSARDSFVTALVSLGEGYHNFHHRFPSDYRNGVRWWQIDPTKWTVWTLSKLGLARDLVRTSRAAIDRARRSVREGASETASRVSTAAAAAAAKAQGGGRASATGAAR